MGNAEAAANQRKRVAGGDRIGEVGNSKHSQRDDESRVGEHVAVAQQLRQRDAEVRGDEVETVAAARRVGRLAGVVDSHTGCQDAAVAAIQRGQRVAIEALVEDGQGGDAVEALIPRALPAHAGDGQRAAGGGAERMVLIGFEELRRGGQRLALSRPVARRVDPIDDSLNGLARIDDQLEVAQAIQQRLDALAAQQCEVIAEGEAGY